MSNKSKDGWENITDDTWRLAVPGGWLYEVSRWDGNKLLGMAMCFVPDEMGEIALGRVKDVDNKD